MKEIISIVFFCLINANGQEFSADSFTQSSLGLNNGDFGSGKTTISDYSLDKFLNPLPNNSTTFKENLNEEQSKNNFQINSPGLDNSKNDSKVEINLFGGVRDFTVSPIDLKKPEISQSFFVSGNSNDSELILKSENNSSNIQHLKTNFSPPGEVVPLTVINRAGFTNGTLSNSLPAPNKVNNFPEGASFSNNFSIPSTVVQISENNPHKTDFSPRDETLPSAINNLPPPPFSAVFNFTDKSSSSNEPNANNPIVSDENTLKFQKQNDTINSNQDDVKQNQFQTTTQPNGPQISVFGNSTPGSWAPKNYPSFPEDKSNKNQEGFSDQKTDTSGGIFLLNRNDNDTKPIFGKSPSSQDGLVFNPTNSNEHLAAENSSLIPDLLENKNNLTDFSKNSNDKLLSTISDQAIFQHNPPFNHKIGLTLTETQKEYSNTSINGLSEINNMNTYGNLTLVEVIKELGANTFLHYLDITGLMSILNNGGTFTIFVPSNKAFDILSASLKEDIASNLEHLRTIISYHIANGTIVSGDFINELIIPSMKKGEHIRINLYSVNETQIVTASGSPISSTNKFSTNGVIHVIDKVMVQTPDYNLVGAVTSLPKYRQLASIVSEAKFEKTLADQTYTFFAPTELAFQKAQGFLAKISNNETALQDILRYHLVPGTFYTEGLVGHPTLSTLANKSLTISVNSGFFKVNSADVSETDFTVSNGVIHSINSLLIPPNYSLK